MLSFKLSAKTVIEIAEGVQHCVYDTKVFPRVAFTKREVVERYSCSESSLSEPRGHGQGTSSCKLRALAYGQ